MSEHPPSAQKGSRLFPFYIELLERSKLKRGLVLATIIETQGSTPQIPGASALFSNAGLLRGTLGGGILEARAQEKALAALDKEQSLLLDFDLTSDTMNTEEAICGGTVKILIDASPHKHLETFRSLHRSHIERRSGIMMTLINRSGKGVQIKRDWIEQSKITHSELGSRQKAFKEAMGKVLLEDRPMLLRVQENLLPEKIRDSLLYLEPVVPSPRLVIAGAGHIGQAVAHLGRLLQFEVIVVDDRPEFANPERIPDADAIIVEDIPQALANFPVCQDTYIVIVTRGHSFDTETLRACISSPAAYIGMIGSRRKVKLIRKSFLKEGWASAEEFDRVYAPIGLEINSKTVEEIAVSIAAQLILVRSGKKETKGKDK